jgi:hypothetical protein
MMHYFYRVFYDAESNRAGQMPLTNDQVAAALNKFLEDLPGYLTGDPLAVVSSGPMIEDAYARRVIALTTLSEAQTQTAINACAAALNLCANRLTGV